MRSQQGLKALSKPADEPRASQSPATYVTDPHQGHLCIPVFICLPVAWSGFGPNNFKAVSYGVHSWWCCFYENISRIRDGPYGFTGEKRHPSLPPVIIFLSIPKGPSLEGTRRVQASAASETPVVSLMPPCLPYRGVPWVVASAESTSQSQAT